MNALGIILPAAFLFSAAVKAADTPTGGLLAAADNTSTRGSAPSAGTLGREFRLPMPRARLLGEDCLLPRGHHGLTGSNSLEPVARLHKSDSDIRFMENRGQIGDGNGHPRSDVLFTADAGGVRLYFRGDGVSCVMADTAAAGRSAGGSDSLRSGLDGDADESSMNAAARLRGHRMFRVDMFLSGCRKDAHVRAENQCPGLANFYLAHCPSGITGVRSYQRIIYEEIYDNIDLVFHSASGRLKYEFIVRPGGDPARIRMRYPGADGLRLDEDGDLIIKTRLGAMRDEAPVSREQDGTPVASAFRIERDEAGFVLGAYNESRTLIIDPWATYCGGGTEDNFYETACDANGNVYAAGDTDSMNFPVLNPWQQWWSGEYDLIITRYSSSGTLDWATFYGGSLDEAHWAEAGLAVDSYGNSVVASDTYSANFPVSANPWQPVKAQYSDAVLIKLDANGQRIWATHFGGNWDETASAAALTASSSILICGWTQSTNISTPGCFQSANAGWSDAFIGEFSSSGQLVWCSYLGGAGIDMAGDLTVTANGDLAVTGETQSGNFPVSAGAFQNTLNGYSDVFVSQFSSAGALQWSTYCGGSGSEQGNAICADGYNSVLVGGRSTSVNFPVSNALQSAHGGSSDGIVVKFSSSGARVWSTYLGGGAFDNLRAMTAESSGTVYVCGNTESANFPVLNSYQPAYAGNQDACITALSANCALLWSTYYGGGAIEAIMSAALGPSGELVTAGFTTSVNLPTISPQQSANGGYYDGFIAVFGQGGSFPVELSSFTAKAAGDDVLLEWETARECGNAGFYIERSRGVEPFSWSRIAFTAGGGNSSMRKAWSHLDLKPWEGAETAALYYRLRQVDADGREQVFPSICVMRGDGIPEPLIRGIFPIPAADEVSIALHSQAGRNTEVSLQDALGRTILTREHAPGTGPGIISVETRGLPAGAYYLALRGAGIFEVRRILIRR